MDFVSDRLADGRWFRILTVWISTHASAFARMRIVPNRARKWSSRMKHLVARGAPQNRSRRTMAANSPVRRWTRGPTSRSEARLHPARPPSSEQIHRELQWPPAGRMSEWGNLFRSRGCSGKTGSMAPRLQSKTPAQRSGRSYAGRVRPSLRVPALRPSIVGKAEPRRVKGPRPPGKNRPPLTRPGSAL